MKSSMLLSLAGWLFVVCYSCTKPVSLLNDPSLTLSGKQAIMTAGSFRPFNSGGGDYRPPAGNDEDTAETPTILGPRLTNPYSLDNMTMAYNIVHSTQISQLTPTNLYVRFLPADIDQLETLADSMDLDLFDTPMDYSIVQDGDYYQDPSIPIEQITWQYAVVQPGFQFPAGITHEILDSIYIPDNDDYEVEDMAFQLAGDPDIDNPSGAPMAVAPYLHDFKCAPGYVWSDAENRCIEICPYGQHWSSTLDRCVANNTPPPSQPPSPPPPGSHYPAGHLYVYDTNLDTDKPLQKVRVVVKRWFKIQRLYTDDNGYFESTKRFHRKAKVNVKFKNSDAIIRCVRGLRIWDAYFAVKVKLGTWSGTLNNISHTFTRNADPDSKGTRYWAAATVNNAVQEYPEMANQLDIGTLPNGRLSIVITNWGGFNGAAATPMYAHYQVGATLDDVQHFIDNFAVVTPFQSLVAGGTRALAKVFFGRVDIIFGYNSGAYSQSDRVRETIYHEFTHAAHFAKVGGGWWGAFRMALISESIYSTGDEDPYGDGSNSVNSPIIALAESWAYHIGYEMENMYYGLHCSTFTESDGNTYSTGGGISSAEHFEEEFNPNNTNDPFHWIPKGLYHDLMDNTPLETPTPDQVSGFTDQQLFNALDNDVNDLGDYKQNLFQENGISQQTQINNLFSYYGY